MTRRKKTPTDIETEVLTKSARRCCICFGVQMDLSHKRGQIAHLDDDPSNSTLDNLAYLCIPHHDEYDSTSRQSKGLTIHEVKKYRTLLYEAVKQMRSDVAPKQNKPENQSGSVLSKETSDVLSKVQSRITPLSQCLVEGIDLAQKAGHKSLEAFCRQELSGSFDTSSSPPSYRVLDTFVSATAKINIDSPLWFANNSNIFHYLQQDSENFFPQKMLITYPLSRIELQINNLDTKKGVIQVSFRAGDVNSKSKNPDAQLVAYIHPSDFASILEGVRREFTVQLLDLLPMVK